MITCYDKERTGKNELDMFGTILKMRPPAYGWITVSDRVVAIVYIPKPTTIDSSGSVLPTEYRRYRIGAAIKRPGDTEGSIAAAIGAVKSGIQNILNECYTRWYTEPDDFVFDHGLALQLHDLYYNSLVVLIAHRIPEPDFDLEIPEIEVDA